MRKIPNKLKILGMEIKVEKNKFLKGSNYGETHSSDNLLKISEEKDIQQQWVTLLHEIAHIISSNLGFELALYGEEQKHTAFIAVLFQVLRDNKLLNIED
jgi:hypothetical protein